MSIIDYEASKPRDLLEELETRIDDFTDICVYGFCGNNIVFLGDTCLFNEQAQIVLAELSAKYFDEQ